MQFIVKIRMSFIFKELNGVYFGIPIVMVAESGPAKLLKDEILTALWGKMGIGQVFDIGWIWWPAIALKALPAPMVDSFTVEWVSNKEKA